MVFEMETGFEWVPLWDFPSRFCMIITSLLFLSVVAGMEDILRKTSAPAAAATAPAAPAATTPVSSHPHQTVTVSGIFIKHVIPLSPAGRSKHLFMGDRICSVSFPFQSLISIPYADFLASCKIEFSFFFFF